MAPTAVVVVNDDPTFQAQLEQCLAETAYAPMPQPTPAAARAQLTAVQPAAVVVKLPSTSPAQEQALLTHLQQDPTSRQIPVLLCSDHPALLQRAVRALQPRPGVVLASTPDADELVAKLAAAAERHP